MKCEKFQLLIPDYCENDLLEAEKALFEKHLSTCPDCQKELIKQKKLSKAIKEDLDGFDPWPEKTFSFNFPDTPVQPLSGWKAFCGMMTSSPALVIVSVIAIATTISLMAYFVGIQPEKKDKIMAFRLIEGSLQTHDMSPIIASEYLVENGSYLATSKAILSISSHSGQESFGGSITITKNSRFSNAGKRKISLLNGGMIVKNNFGHLILETSQAKINIAKASCSIIANQSLTLVTVVSGKAKVEFGNKYFLIDSKEKSQQQLLVEKGEIVFKNVGINDHKVWKKLESEGNSNQEFFDWIKHETKDKNTDKTNKTDRENSINIKIGSDKVKVLVDKGLIASESNTIASDTAKTGKEQKNSNLRNSMEGINKPIVNPLEVFGE